MMRKENLPFLPGFVINKPKENHHLPHRWDYISGTNIIVENESKTNSTDCNTIIANSNLFPTSSNLPDWITYDRKILCFTAYFREDLQETYTATYQIRKVKILYHLEDGTIQVVEPRTDNSGISQGSIVSRQRISHSKLGQNNCLSILDLNVQKNVKIFDRIYTITDCDAFTRKFLIGAGINVPEPIELPCDPTQLVRQRQKDETQPTKPKMKHDEKNKLEKFLKFGTSCLKFMAYWDDRNSPGGDVHDLILYYYLCDDTIQINEIDDDGKSTKLFKRQKLPKKNDACTLVGQKSNFTVLNVLGRDFMRARYVQDRLNLGRPEIEYYLDKDLKIGETIDVLGRKVILTDCDNFTQNYYFEKFGIEEFQPIMRPNRVKWQQKNIDREIPPYNGWGSLADSEANCLSLIPKPPHRDINKFLTLDRCNLRFKARMISDIFENCERMFVITYYLSDDSISVYEISGRNSGFPSGDFYKRTKLDGLDPQRFYLGATVHLIGFDFKLIDADEFTLKYMEMHPFEFPMSNISSIMSKVKLAIKPIYKDFIAKYLTNVSVSSTLKSKQHLYICFNTMREALIDLLGQTITEHEILTFLRYFSVKEPPIVQSNSVDRNTIQTLVGIEINRRLWNDTDNLKALFYDMNPNYMDEYLSKQKLRSIIIGCRIPIKGHLMNEMFSVLNKNERDEIEIKDFLYFIDICLSVGDKKMLHLNILNTHASESNHHQQLIDWSAFIDELGLEEELKQGVE